MVRLRMVGGVLAAVVMAGCSSPGIASAAEASRAEGTAEGAAAAKGARAAGYLTAIRLLSARGQGAATSRLAETSPASPRVGALFSREGSGGHFCTASVVSSPGRDLLITAAHCINGGDGRGYRRDVVFIPGYQDGKAPYGVWTPARMLVAQGWARSADPDLDVGFVVLKPRYGEDIQQVLGASTMAFDAGYRRLVQVTGYPDGSQRPITCQNWTSRQSAGQLRFNCDGFTNGTSGGPWITGYNPYTRIGRVVGVIGGYQQGGDTADVSYSPYFGSAIRRLYQEAVSG